MSLDSNPDAKKFYLVALQRLEDAEVLLNNPTRRRTSGSMYLSGFAVECILKALILANSTHRNRPALLRDLKEKHGHNLETLRQEAARRGSHMQEDVIEEFRRLNTWNNNIRYDPGIQSMAEATGGSRAAARVIRWARRAVRATDE